MIHFIVLIAFLFSFKSEKVFAFTNLPSQKSQLSNFNLTKRCQNVKIVEWKPSFNHPETEFSTTNLEFIDQVCQLVVNNFDSFVAQELQLEDYNKNLSLQVNISLLPAKMDQDGADYASLNDLVFRFASRAKEYPQPLWGYFHPSDGHLYLRNDILLISGQINSNFVTVLAHEFWHALSYQNDIYQQLERPKIEDEQLARRFTKYIGLGE